MNFISRFFLSLMSCSFLIGFNTINYVNAVSTSDNKDNIDSSQIEEFESEKSNEENLPSLDSEKDVTNDSSSKNNVAKGASSSQQPEGTKVGNVKINVKERTWEANYSIYYDDNGKIVKVVSNI